MRSTGYAHKSNQEVAIVTQSSRALLYLRVSTPQQLRPDIGPEGLSIPAQRDACRRAAQHADLTIVDEYIEPGRSGRTITQRPVLQELLERVRSDTDITHLIVYELSRLARNRADDVHIVTELTAHSVTLVSATENVDATPVGQLTHGLLAAVNEYRSARDGADIAYKMSEKAKRGGTLGRAPIGYTNTLQRRDGHDSRSVQIDPIRGPLIHRTFELFATDRYNYEQLSDLMLEHGLSRTSHPDQPPRSIGTTGIARLLTCRYYLGIVTYTGTERPGQHPPLITQQQFDNAQAIIARRQASSQRRSRLDHYLKGTLYCEKCLHAGNPARLLATSRRQISNL